MIDLDAIKENATSMKENGYPAIRIMADDLLALCELARSLTNNQPTTTD